MVIQEGAMVRERQTVVRMPDMDRLQIRVHLDKSDVQRIRKGQPVVVRIDAFPDQTLSGEVAEISDKPDRERTTWHGTENKHSVVVSIKNPGLPLRLGMTASVEFERSEAER
jgi:multidrug resistance efflux pump